MAASTSGRPRRKAAERARALFQSGFRLPDSDDEQGPLDSDEESQLDADLAGSESDADSDASDSGAQPLPPEPPTKKKRAARKKMPQRGQGDGPAAARFSTYDDPDPTKNDIPFKPARVPGPQLGDRITRNKMLDFTRAIDFFQLYFTLEIITMICDNTNMYGWLKVLEKPSYASPDGGWPDTTPDELYKFIGLLIYMGFVQVPSITRYWSTAVFYNGLWARQFMPRDRFKALLGMLHVSDPTQDAANADDKLCKIRPLLDYIQQKCMELFQAYIYVSVDERMVKSKGRSGIRQFIKDKPVRFGFKLWVLADSSTGYTLNFKVYTGRREQGGEHGLAYDVVTMICNHLAGQGYEVYFDNFYTSIVLMDRLSEMGLGACGTCRDTRRGFPEELRDKQWGKRADRGDMRYVRLGKTLCLQWKDNKVVTMLSTLHSGSGHVETGRRVKVDGQWEQRMVRKPAAIDAYNKHMGGVDMSDQLIARYNVLIKSLRWWKTLFFHMVDVSVVDSYILFQQWRARHPEIKELQRGPDYSQLSFREELARQLGGIHEDQQVPLYRPEQRLKAEINFQTDHIPLYSDTRHNCTVCYATQAVEHKCHFTCSAEGCRRFHAHFCLNKHRNCFKRWHSNQFSAYRREKYSS